MKQAFFKAPWIKLSDFKINCYTKVKEMARYGSQANEELNLVHKHLNAYREHCKHFVEGYTNKTYLLNLCSEKRNEICEMKLLTQSILHLSYIMTSYRSTGGSKP